MGIIILSVLPPLLYIDLFKLLYMYIYKIMICMNMFTVNLFGYQVSYEISTRQYYICIFVGPVLNEYIMFLNLSSFLLVCGGVSTANNQNSQYISIALITSSAQNSNQPSQLIKQCDNNILFPFQQYYTNTTWLEGNMANYFPRGTDNESLELVCPSFPVEPHSICFITPNRGSRNVVIGVSTNEML